MAELAQYFVPERGTSLLDLAANILGVFIGLIAYRWLVAQYNRPAHRNNAGPRH